MKSLSINVKIIKIDVECPWCGTKQLIEVWDCLPVCEFNCFYCKKVFFRNQEGICHK